MPEAADGDVGDGPWTGGSYDEFADPEMQKLLRAEPLASFFRGCGPRAAPSRAEGEKLCLASHLCTPSAPYPHPALAPTEQMPPALRLLANTYQEFTGLLMKLVKTKKLQMKVIKIS